MYFGVISVNNSCIHRGYLTYGRVNNEQIVVYSLQFKMKSSGECYTVHYEKPEVEESLLLQGQVVETLLLQRGTSETHIPNNIYGSYCPC